MRLYYCFVSGSTTLAGAVFAHAQTGSPWSWRDAVILLCGFSAWGINQIFNDYFDLESDRINAPFRPMAAGDLDPRKALKLSAFLMLLLAGASFLASPMALLAAGAGAGFNLLYSKLKKIPVINCIAYSAALSCCVWYGYAGVCGNDWERFFSFDALILPLLVMPVHYIMCALSYYKDREGDLKAGILTLQNIYPDWLILSLDMLLTAGVLIRFISVQPLLSQLYSGILLLPLAGLLFQALWQKEYHKATKYNCQFCAVWLLCISAWCDSFYFIPAAVSLVLIEILYSFEAPQKRRFITGSEKFFFYVKMSLRCALKIRSLPALLKAGKFTRIFYCHKLLQMPTGEYKLDFYMPRFPSEAFFTAMADKVISSPPRPVSVVWSVTRACSYRCPHCYQGFDPAEEMPIEIMRSKARELRESGVAAWAVEGGEPLLRFERLTALLEEIQGLEVWVNSTGCGAEKEKISRLRELKVTGCMSSIHSVLPREHDRFTGIPGSFETALDFLRQCRSAGMLTGFNTVLSDEEILSGAIDRIMDLAAKEDCDYVQLIHPKACGRWHEKAFDPILREKAAAAACAAQKCYNSGAKKNAPILTAQVFEESPEMLGCTAGAVDRFYVGCSGEVQPCEFVNLSFGNLCRESYSEIYDRMRRTFPVPCCEWLCCQYNSAIASAIQRNGGRTPLPWEVTREILKDHRPGTPTPVYKAMEICR